MPEAQSRPATSRLGVVLAIVVGILGIVLVILVGFAGKLSEVEELTLDTVIPVPVGVKRVLIEFDFGNMTVHPDSAAQLRFDGRLRKMSDTVEDLAVLRALDSAFRVVSSEGGLLHIVGPRLPDGLDPTRNRVVVRTTVHMPRDLEVEIVAHQISNLMVKERDGAVRLTTPSGDLSLKSVAGAALLRTGHGNVIVSEHRGSLNIEVARAGRIIAHVEEIGSAGVLLLIGDGGIQASVPAAASFVLDMQTAMGEVENAFGVPVEKRDLLSFTCRGTVGAGGPLVRIQSRDSGHITLGRLHGSR